MKLRGKYNIPDEISIIIKPDHTIEAVIKDSNDEKV